tara:strand:+ start:228 stop:1103 length:876 start_codon:yes stop_codon:yes gene_type:complete
MKSNTKENNTEKKRILIIGCGYIGQSLCDKLLEKNYLITTVNRSKVIKQATSSLQIDVSKPYEIDGTFDTVIYSVSAESYTKESYNNAYSLGVANTIKALKRKNQKPHFIFTSSTSVFSENKGKWVTEESAVQSNHFASQSILEGESFVKTSLLPYSIVRFSGIYGPKRDRLIQKIKEKKLKLKSKNLISNRIHKEDCVGVLLHLIQKNNDASLYIASDDNPSDYNEILVWLKNELGIKENILVEATEEKNKHMSNKKCSNKKITQDGYKFIYPSYQEGFSQILKDQMLKN